MKKILGIWLLIFLYANGFAQNDSANTQQKPDSTKVQTAPKQADSGKQAETAKNKADSASFSAAYEFQRNNPEILYVNKLKTFTPSFFLCTIFFLAIGIWLLLGTGLCKDLSYDPQTNILRDAKVRPYSYARVQLFWWTLNILICFTSFFFYTGWLVAFNSTVVLLLGGGLAVSVFGNVIDKTQISQNNNGVPIRHQDIKTTEGLFTDILSDDGGISIHRFQAVVFNIVFGLGFFHSFFTSVKTEIFPFIEFEPWQLTVLGISAAGYLGFKTTENSDSTKPQREVEAVKNVDVNVAAQLQVAQPLNLETTAFQNLRTIVDARYLI